MLFRRTLLSLGLLALSLPLASGCGGCSGSGPRINAGGATFVDPIMQKWSGEYKRLKNAEIDYIDGQQFADWWEKESAMLAAEVKRIGKIESK